MPKKRLRALCVLVAALGAFAGASAAPSLTHRWTLAIDSRTTGQWLAVRGEVVYCLRSAHLAAIDLTTGHVQRLDGSRPVRLVTNTSDARFLTSTGKSAYFATNDGSIVAVADLDHPASATHLTTSCRFVEGVHVVQRGALVHCDDARSASRLYAFRFAGPH